MTRLAVVLLAGWLAGCATAPTDAPVPTGDDVLYVVARGWHTDIGLKVASLDGKLASLAGDFPGVRFMVFGFGERAFYMAHEAHSGAMLAALFPSKSAILMTALNAAPPAAFPDEQVVTLRVPHAVVARIAALIWESLETTPAGATRLGEGPYVGSMFYASHETYDLFYTCNTWTARILRDAGLPVDPRGALFADQVMRQVKAIAAAQDRSAGRAGAVGTDRTGAWRDHNGGVRRRWGIAAAEAEAAAQQQR